jgi:hypothetical protein
MEKNPDPGSGSVMNVLDLIFENLASVFWVKKYCLNSLMGIRIRDLGQPWIRDPE